MGLDIFLNVLKKNDFIRGIKKKIFIIIIQYKLFLLILINEKAFQTWLALEPI
jgi:hypothetical protein